MAPWIMRNSLNLYAIAFLDEVGHGASELGLQRRVLREILF